MLYDIFMQLNPSIDPDRPKATNTAAEASRQKKRMYRGAEVAVS